MTVCVGPVDGILADPSPHTPEGVAQKCEIRLSHVRNAVARRRWDLGGLCVVVHCYSRLLPGHGVQGGVHCEKSHCARRSLTAQSSCGNATGVQLKASEEVS